MNRKVLKILLFIGLIILLTILYVRTGDTYYANVGFGGPSITIRLGTFSYNYSSDIGNLGYSVGFAKLTGNRVKLTPIRSLSSENYPGNLQDSFIKIQCGERRYLVQENELMDFFEWTNDYELAASSSSTMQPYYILNGDEKKEYGNCSKPI